MEEEKKVNGTPETDFHMYRQALGRGYTGLGSQVAVPAKGEGEKGGPENDM
jgi:hypothetical protein